MAEQKKLTRAQIEEAFMAATKKDNLCNLGKIIEGHEHGKIVAEKVADELHYSATTISAVLKGLDFPPVSAEVISKHRRGLCRCPKEA